MHFIEHIIEPEKLLLIWQSSEESHRSRYVVGELYRSDDTINLRYLPETTDFKEAQKQGFESYIAFPDTQQIYSNVLDTFMRRLPPKKREDFPQYLENFRIPKEATFSLFALLGYIGAKSPSDNFSLIHPFNNIQGSCELLVEATGYRHLPIKRDIQIGDAAHFEEQTDEETCEKKIAISVNNELIGYVTHALLPTFQNWIQKKLITEAWVEKKNGQPGKPTLYLYVKVCTKIVC